MLKISVVDRKTKHIIRGGLRHHQGVNLFQVQRIEDLAGQSREPQGIGAADRDQVSFGY